MFGRKKVDVGAEMKRRKSQNEQMLAEFKHRRQLFNFELADISLRYSARLGDLRNAGHKIVAEYVRPGVWRYTYYGYNPSVKVS